MAEEKSSNLPPAQFFNVLRTTHTRNEFFLDVGQFSDGSGMAALVTRLVTTPSHMKEVLRVLTENIARYEAAFGEIQAPARETH